MEKSCYYDEAVMPPCFTQRRRADRPKGGAKMNKYETVIIINPVLDEAATKAVIEKFTAMINESGKVESTEEWGKKRLAYPINKQNEGYYVLINFTSNPEFIDELERVYNITDDVIKHMVVRNA